MNKESLVHTGQQFVNVCLMQLMIGRYQTG